MMPEHSLIETSSLDITSGELTDFITRAYSLRGNELSRARKEFEGEGRKAIFAREGDKVIGSLVFRQLPNDILDEVHGQLSDSGVFFDHPIEITGMAVDPYYRGVGVYRSMVAFLLEQCPEIDAVFASTSNLRAVLAQISAWKSTRKGRFITSWGGIPASFLPVERDIVEIHRRAAFGYIKMIGGDLIPDDFRFNDRGMAYIYSLRNPPEMSNAEIESFIKKYPELLGVLSNIQNMERDKFPVVSAGIFDPKEIQYYNTEAALISIKEW